MKNSFKAYKIAIWILSAIIVALLVLSLVLFFEKNKRNFETNLTEEIEVLITEKGLNLASIYFPNSLVGNTVYKQKLKLKIGEEIEGLKLKMLASNLDNTNAQGEVELTMPESWEKDGDYYIFKKEIIPSSSIEVETIMTLPNLNKERSNTAIISIVVMAS